MKRITGGPMYPQKVKLAAGYALADEGMDWKEGRVGVGPFAGNETTVCLLPNDDGKWFTSQVEANNGTWKLYEDQPAPAEQVAS